MSYLPFETLSSEALTKPAKSLSFQPGTVARACLRLKDLLYSGKITKEMRSFIRIQLMQSMASSALYLELSSSLATSANLDFRPSKIFEAMSFSVIGECILRILKWSWMCVAQSLLSSITS